MIKIAELNSEVAFFNSEIVQMWSKPRQPGTFDPEPVTQSDRSVCTFVTAIT